MLQLRVVCSSWKKSIDLWLQSHPEHTTIGFHKMSMIERVYGNSMPDPDDFCQWFGSSSNLEDFVIMVSETPRANPFFSGYTVYCESTIQEGNNDAEIRRRRDAFKSIMTKFGKSVFHIDLSLVALKSKGGEIYEFLRCLFALMPNLKSIKMEVSNIYTESSERKQVKVAKMDRFFKSNPLPNLKSLEFLGIKNLSQNLERGFLTQYKNIKTLRHLPKLETFNPLLFYSLIEDVAFSSLDAIEFYITCREDLNLLRLHSWPLKSLKINLNIFHGEDCDLNFIFGNVSQFSKTLQNLMIAQAKIEWEDEFDYPILLGRLELPHLKTFKICHNNIRVRNIDFLISCPELEYIDLSRNEFCDPPGSCYSSTIALKQKQRRSCSNPDNQQEIIKFRDYYATMYDSNVWQVLPKLQALSLDAKTSYECDVLSNIYGTFSFTRSTWDLYQKIATRSR